MRSLRRLLSSSRAALPLRREGVRGLRRLLAPSQSAPSLSDGARRGVRRLRHLLPPFRVASDARAARLRELLDELRAEDPDEVEAAQFALEEEFGPAGIPSVAALLPKLAPWGEVCAMDLLQTLAPRCAEDPRLRPLLEALAIDALETSTAGRRPSMDEFIDRCAALILQTLGTPGALPALDRAVAHYRAGRGRDDWTPLPELEAARRALGHRRSRTASDRARHAPRSG